MKLLIYELTESVRIAFAQIRAHKLRSVLTALGVIIGIVAVTLMGMAIAGMNTSFENSLALLGEDVLYVQKWPWFGVEDWWNYANRPPLRPESVVVLNRIFAETPNSLLEIAAPMRARSVSVKVGEYSVSGVFLGGTTADFGRIMTADLREGRLFRRRNPTTAGRWGCSAAMWPMPCFPAGPPWARVCRCRAMISRSSESSPAREISSGSLAWITRC